ncbi:sulfurtransferase TusA [Endozoicomonas sp. ONNA2]|uniref:sulfurtransferase TusA n=1 Tax=Endozoicomonas sp. ONNA2 TaxID=2828741 RepID=UPI00214945BB|nr:sulfurtransferase TusA [Endozoicomonas sp. ONNA2]
MSDRLLEKSVGTIKAQHELDTSGLFCPEPVMMLHNKIRDMAPGEVVRVLATDPSTQRDIPKFCHFLNHSLVHHQETEAVYFYWIRKRGGNG